MHKKVFFLLTRSNPIFVLILNMFLTSQAYEFNEIAQKGPYYGVENDCRKLRLNSMDSF